MNKLTLLTMTIGLLALAAGLAAWQRSPAAGDRDTSPPAVAPVGLPAAPASPTAGSPWPALQTSAVPAREVIPDADTTGLLQESMTLDELLDAADAGSAEPLSDADRDRLAILIQSDPELRKHLGD